MTTTEQPRCRVCGDALWQMQAAPRVFWAHESLAANIDHDAEPVEAAPASETPVEAARQDLVFASAQVRDLKTQHEFVQRMRRFEAAVRAQERAQYDATYARMMATGAALNDARDALAAERERTAHLEVALGRAIEAFRLTREYVGEGLLPAHPGWSWFDSSEEMRALLATEEAKPSG